MWAAGAAAAENLQWTQGGVKVPVPPPVWDPCTTNDKLCTYIAAHNSYVSAVAAQRTAEAIVSFTEGAAAEAEGTPTSKRCRVFDSLDEAAAPEKLAADGGTSAGDSGGNGIQVTAATRPARQGTAARMQSLPVSETQPHIHALRRTLTKYLFYGLLKPHTPDKALHSPTMVDELFKKVVMEVHKTDDKGATNLLKTVFRPPSRPVKRFTKRMPKPAAPVKLKLWMSKARNNVHCSLSRAIEAAWTTGAKLDQSAEAAGNVLKGRGYIKGIDGRRGVILGYLVMVHVCGGKLEECTFPDGEDSAAAISTFLSSLAFVLSKVRSRWGDAEVQEREDGRRV